MKKLHVKSHKKKSVRRTSKMFSSLLSLRRPMQVNHVTMVTYSWTLTTYVSITEKLVIHIHMFPCKYTERLRPTGGETAWKIIPKNMKKVATLNFELSYLFTQATQRDG